jgi:hypothetical protein
MRRLVSLVQHLNRRAAAGCFGRRSSELQAALAATPLCRCTLGTVRQAGSLLELLAAAAAPVPLLPLLLLLMRATQELWGTLVGAELPSLSASSWLCER